MELTELEFLQVQVGGLIIYTHNKSQKYPSATSRIAYSFSST
jgi:hypothetical protein